MKKINILSLLCLVAIALSVGCSKDKGIDSSVLEGKPTTVTFSFDVAGSNGGTRSSSDAMQGDGGLDAAAFKDTDFAILIFDEAGSQSLTTRATTGLSLVGGDGKITLETTSGSKRIYVLTNMGPRILAKINALTVGTTTLDQFYNLMTDPVISSPTEALTGLGDDFKEIVNPFSDNVYLAMANTASLQSRYFLNPDISMGDSENAEGTTAEEKAEKNNISMVLKRGVAKVRLMYSGVISEDPAVGLVYQAKNDPAYLLGAVLGDIKYGIRNMNASTYGVQRFGDDDTPDNDVEEAGNKEDPIRPHTPYYNLFPNLTDQTNENFDKYYVDGDVDIVAVKNYVDSHSKYLPENSNANQVIGNTTYVGISTIIRRVPSKYIITDLILSVDGQKNPLKQRFYTNTVIESNDFKFTENNTKTTNNVNNPNILYVQRRETTTGVTFSNSEARIFKDQGVAFKTMFIQLEAAGFIGTPDNNNTVYNQEIWEAFGQDGSSTAYGPTNIPTQQKTPADPTNDARERGTPGDLGYLYFNSYEGLKTLYNQPLTPANSPADDEVMGYNHPVFKMIDKLYELKFPDGTLSEFFGIYINARTYYRVNFFQKVTAGNLNLVRRNHAYNVNITGFKNIGEPNVEDLDKRPSEPVDQRVTNVTANITVLGWHEIDITGDI